MAERKLVVVKNNGILEELGGIGGPILTPTRIPLDHILKMINNNKAVYECCPTDPRNENLWLPLTQANYKLNNFEAGVHPAETPVEPEPVAPAVPETPVEPTENPEPEIAVQSMENSNINTDTEVQPEPVAPAVPETPVEPTENPEPVVTTPQDHTNNQNDKSGKRSKKNK